MKKYNGLKIASLIFLLGGSVYVAIMLFELLTAVDATALAGALLASIFSIAIIAPIYVVGMILAVVGLVLAKKSGAKIGTFVLEIILPILFMAVYVIMILTA